MHISCHQNINMERLDFTMSSSLMQLLHNPEWKWDNISMNFVTGSPKTSKGNYSVWVIVDGLTKSSHFIPINISYSLENLADEV